MRLIHQVAHPPAHPGEAGPSHTQLLPANFSESWLKEAWHLHVFPAAIPSAVEGDNGGSQEDGELGHGAQRPISTAGLSLKP